MQLAASELYGIVPLGPPTRTPTRRKSRHSGIGDVHRREPSRGPITELPAPDIARAGVSKPLDSRDSR